MGRPSDKEYALQRKLKDSEAKTRLLENEVAQLKKKIEKLEQASPEEHKVKPKNHSCPKCNASIKVSDLPFGQLLICVEACGYREVKRG